MANSDAERDGAVGSEPSEEVGADKFPVRYQAVGLVVANHREELPQQRDAILGIELPLLARTRKKRGKAIPSRRRTGRGN